MTNHPIDPVGEQVAEFYDEFKEQQTETGVNLRHYMVFDLLRKAGFKPNHHVFEIGCGIGTFTQLMASYLKSGKIIATDISRESVELARANPKMKGRAEFLVSDMRQFEYPGKFDFVVMVDVLEHIPIDQYNQLFSIISRHMKESAKLAINIPHPQIIEYLRIHSPEKLQIIDNPVKMDILAEKTYAEGLELFSYLPYRIFHNENDYIFMTFSKKGNQFSYTNMSKNKIRKRKLAYKLRFTKSIF